MIYHRDWLRKAVYEVSEMGEAPDGGYRIEKEVIYYGNCGLPAFAQYVNFGHSAGSKENTDTSIIKCSSPANVSLSFFRGILNGENDTLTSCREKSIPDYTILKPSQIKFTALEYGEMAGLHILFPSNLDPDSITDDYLNNLIDNEIRVNRKEGRPDIVLLSHYFEDFVCGWDTLGIFMFRDFELINVKNEVFENILPEEFYTDSILKEYTDCIVKKMLYDLSQKGKLIAKLNVETMIDYRPEKEKCMEKDESFYEPFETRKKPIVFQFDYDKMRFVKQ